MDTAPLEGKRFWLLHEIVPQVAAIGVLLNPSNPLAGDQLRARQEAARAIGLRVHVLLASSDREIEAAFETIAGTPHLARNVGSTNGAELATYAVEKKGKPLVVLAK
jgi:putative ABC transport system substrate-binding protein